MGGYVALAMARRAPERIRALLLAGSRATADPPDRRELREEMIRVVQEEGIEGWNREFSPPGPPNRPTEELVRGIEALRHTSVIVTLRGIEALRDRPDATDVVTSFAGPLVVVVCDQDDILPVEEARQIAESAPNARFEVVAGAGHVVSVDAPDRFNQILLELLQSAS